MQKNNPSILIVGPSWVGDMVMAQSLFLFLKNQYPQSKIDVVAPEWSLPVLQRMPEVRQGIGLPLGHGRMGLMQRYRIGKRLRSLKYDQAIVLPRSFKAALIPFFANIPIRTAFRGEWRYGLINDMRSFDKAILDQTVKRFVALGFSRGRNFNSSSIQFPHLNVDKNSVSKLLEKFSLNKNKKIIGLMPGAEYGPAKQWPLEYFAELIKKIEALGLQAWIFGSAKDSIGAEKILELSQGTAINLCGKTALQEVIDLIAQVDVAVSNDSGLMHVAAAVEVPVIAIYGSSSPSFTPPLTNKAEVLYRHLTCSPCFQRQCPLQHLNCLREITPDSVISKIQLKLSEKY